LSVDFSEKLWHGLMMLKKMGVANSPEIVVPFCLLASVLCTKLKILVRSS